MLTKETLLSLLKTYIGILLIGCGVLWEIMLGPGYPGWGLILTGIILENWRVGRRWRWVVWGWPLLLLLLLSGLSLWVTANFEVTFVQFDRLLASLILCVAIYEWTKEKPQLILITLGLVTLGVSLALVAPVAVEWHKNKIGLIPNTIYNWFPLLLPDPVHPNVMAAIMVMIFPLPLAFVLNRQPAPTPLQRLIWWCALGVAFLLGLILLLTRSRGGYIALVAEMITVFWFCRHRIWAVIMLVGWVSGGAWFVSGSLQPASATVSALADTNTFAFRLTVWKTAVAMIRDFPFTGVGMGTFNDVATRLYPFPVVPTPGTHNLYLQVAVDLGLMGLIAFLAILLLALFLGRRSLQWARQTNDFFLIPMIIGTMAGIVAFMVHGLVDIVVWGTRTAFMPWVLIGLITAVYQYSLHQQTAVADC